MNEKGLVKTWSSEIKTVLTENNMQHIFDSNELFPVQSNVAELRKSMWLKQTAKLKEDCSKKPKLRTFVTFKDFSNLSPHLFKPLSFVERKTLSKLRLSILPIRIETARFSRSVIPEKERVCYCGSLDVESESHVLFNASSTIISEKLGTKKCSFLMIS